MTLAELKITHLRNIHSAHLLLHPRLNIIAGANGSGKTSSLEALYLLSSGHSFRTREISALVTQGQELLTIFAKSDDSQRISIQKSQHLSTIAQLNGQPCLSSSQLAAFLPCQVFYQDIFQLIDAGPALRRSLLDWGLFHVKHDYLTLWKDYRRALKQRNALLRQRAAASQLLPWNKLLNDIAILLDDYRSAYFQQLVVIFNRIVKQLSGIDCELHYYRGWDRKNEGKSLLDVLTASYDNDLSRQFTHYGAHQADLFVISTVFKAKHFLSRGQQKVVLFALKFAQAELVKKDCLYLIDDLSAELDEEHTNKILEHIDTMQGQFFITTRPDSYSENFLRYNHHSFLLQKGVFEQKN